MLGHEPARYEFRAFAADLGHVSERLAQIASAVQREAGQETYVVSRLHTGANVKLRDGNLDVKRLEVREGVFEQWRPVLHAPLPISRELWREQVATLLGVTLEEEMPAQLAAKEILSIAARAPELRAVEIHKKRTKFIHADGLSEHVQLAVCGAKMQSAAVESAKIDAALRLLKHAMLEGFTNTSYPVFLAGLGGCDNKAVS